jgi:AbrB family looped-hinge helix DNA binding protein
MVRERGDSAERASVAAARLRHDIIAGLLQYRQNAAMKTPVTITSRGVITLPSKLRQALGLKADDQLIAETTPEGLLLRPAVTLPLEIYTAERVLEFDQAEAELARALEPAATRRPARARRPR